jgi:hypothetical protein
MTPKEAAESVGKKVYGFGFDNDPVEALTVISVEELNPRDKKAKIRTFVLQDAKGNTFKTGINDYFQTELECSIAVNKQIESLIASSESEIKSLQDTINNYKKQQAKLTRKIKTMTHLESIKTKK